MGLSTGVVLATTATIGALLIASVLYLRSSSDRAGAAVLNDGRRGDSEKTQPTHDTSSHGAQGAHTTDGNGATFSANGAAAKAANGGAVHGVAVEAVSGTAAANGGAAANGAATSGAAATAVADDGPVTQEAKELAALYGRMAEDFKANDLNAAAIEPLRSWFHGTGAADDDTPWPKQYAEFDQPLQFGAVRLLVVPLDDSPAVLRIAAAVTADVMRLLPQGTKVFANARGNYHCTVFHTSQPSDPRPDPRSPDGGLGPGGASLPPSARRLQSEAEWAAELETVRDLVAATPVPVLRLERVVQASSGVLLLTWTEVGQGAVLSGLRRRLREAFPGAPAKQATIIHSSLLRIVSPAPLGPPAVAAISAACERWTARLRGTQYSPHSLWFVRETEFSTVVGQREVLTLADRGAPVRHF